MSLCLIQSGLIGLRQKEEKEISRCFHCAMDKSKRQVIKYVKAKANNNAGTQAGLPK